MLVGDLIQDIREAVTDQPQTLSPPPIAFFSFTPQAPAGGEIPPLAGTYYIVVTGLNSWGETLPSAVSGPIALNGAQVINVTGSIPGSYSAVRFYVGTDPGGNEGFYTQTNSLPIDLTIITVPQFPPSRSTAYLPDSDGDAISASTLFRWVNRGLELASQVAGGLFDYGGLGTTTGVPGYIAPGEWKKISSMWYDGYPLAMDDAGNYFRRNAITASVLASIAVSLFTERMMLEVWPQPSRSAAATTLAAQFNVGDTQAVVASTGGFLLTNGFVKIGSEICSYSGFAGNTLKNLIRGLAGTVQAQVANGQPVQELNMFWQGWRMYAPNFVPGQSGLLLPVPVSWNSLLFQYGLGRAKLAEQGLKDFIELDKNFKEEMLKVAPSNLVSVGPRQVGEPSNALEVWPNFAGGFVVP